MATVGPNTALSVVNGNDGDTDWVNAGNVGVSDNIFASAEIENNEFSENLVLYNFGFSLDSSFTITGIEVHVERSADDSGNIVDNVVRLLKAGSIVGDNKAGVVNWPSAEAVITYGGDSDLWGETWLYSDINHAGFGLVFKVENEESHGAPTVAQIDYISITIYYTVPSAEGSFTTKINIF